MYAEQYYHHHHHHHHPRISSRRKSWDKTSGPLCVTYYTTAVMSMLLWPIVCSAVWSAEQFRLQCTLECPQRWQLCDRRQQRIPYLCRGNGEGAIENMFTDNITRWFSCIFYCYSDLCTNCIAAVLVFVMLQLLARQNWRRKVGKSWNKKMRKWINMRQSVFLFVLHISKYQKRCLLLTT